MYMKTVIHISENVNKKWGNNWVKIEMYIKFDQITCSTEQCASVFIWANMYLQATEKKGYKQNSFDKFL